MDILSLKRKRVSHAVGQQNKRVRGDTKRPAPPAEPAIRRAPKIGGWDEYSDGLRAYYKKRAEEDLMRRRVYSREKASTDRLHETFSCEGDRILERIRMRMASMGLVRTKPLQQIWNAIIMAQLQQIYGKDFVRKIPELLKEFGVEELHQLTEILTMRQAGKTTAVQSGLAACILEIPHNKMVAFGPTKRQAVQIAIGTVAFIMIQPDGPLRIVSKNQENLIVTPVAAGMPFKSNPNNSILRCLPPSEKGLVFVLYLFYHHNLYGT